MRKRSAGRLAVAMQLLLLLAAPAWAVRPFITDDARVVGARLAQLETWIQAEEHSVSHWLLASIGPTDWRLCT